MDKKYYLISYGYHYGNSGSASHGMIATTKTPAEFIKESVNQAEKDRLKKLTYNNQFHIISVLEITEEEYKNWYTEQ
jgi:hypothetical protein